MPPGEITASARRQLDAYPTLTWLKGRVEAMGCTLEETPMGIQVRTDAESKTSVTGVFACGDVAHAPHSVSLAVGNGAMAGAQVHRSLLWPETIAPKHAVGRVR